MTELTESEGWTYLSRLWDSPAVYGGYVQIKIEKVGHSRDCPAACIQCLGLCESIDALEDTDRISKETKIKMHGRLALPTGVTQNRTGYCWPFTAAGAKERAEFCRRQASIH